MGLLKWLKGIFGNIDIPPHDYVDSALVFPIAESLKADLATSLKGREGVSSVRNGALSTS
jgi:hypothetical protein